MPGSHVGRRGAEQPCGRVGSWAAMRAGGEPGSHTGRWGARWLEIQAAAMQAGSWAATQAGREPCRRGARQLESWAAMWAGVQGAAQPHKTENTKKIQRAITGSDQRRHPAAGATWAAAWLRAAAGSAQGCCGLSLPGWKISEHHSFISCSGVQAALPGMDHTFSQNGAAYNREITVIIL